MAAAEKVERFGRQEEEHEARAAQLQQEHPHTTTAAATTGMAQPVTARGTGMTTTTIPAAVDVPTATTAAAPMRTVLHTSSTTPGGVLTSARGVTGGTRPGYTTGTGNITHPSSDTGGAYLDRDGAPGDGGYRALAPGGDMDHPSDTLPQGAKDQIIEANDKPMRPTTARHDVELGSADAERTGPLAPSEGNGGWWVVCVGRGSR